ncbi:uncharacterized protein BYT42DRAFT_565449 [Radiomyces spectabilis]|uniref:uncharacterized protein n=1 Tax=Radiomyces spectabilis TaxID=64574 RepID=UPI00221EB91F|nr:uncharacterized protein BYT42DRAFT_565449 [Radiomyces spectabilis]KAI8381151.1 hypothetical protein BYT42DRAFT_565449 [Radiomyces spectabilis]
MAMHRYSMPAVPPSHDKLNPLHNLMNYSIPLHDSSLASLPSQSYPRRSIQDGDANTRLKQVDHEIDQLTLSNIRLMRANRILKLECDRLVDQQTRELKQEMNELLQLNVRLQRSNRLLQDELNAKTEEINQLKEDQIRKMKTVGPEYEYLVQMINLLYRQLEGKPTCDKTCCYTNQPLRQGFSVLTLPPETEVQKPKPQHICRPVIHSNLSGGDLACALEKENVGLRQEIMTMAADRDVLCEMLRDKEEDAETLKCELRMKDDIVTQLERDFERMELEVIDLQKDWRYSDRLKSESSFSDIHAFPIPPPLPKTTPTIHTVTTSGESFSSGSSPTSPMQDRDFFATRQ